MRLKSKIWIGYHLNLIWHFLKKQQIKTNNKLTSICRHCLYWLRHSCACFLSCLLSRSCWYSSASLPLSISVTSKCNAKKRATQIYITKKLLTWKTNTSSLNPFIHFIPFIPPSFFRASLLRYGRIWLTAQAGGSGLCKFLQILSTINAANLPKLPATLKKRAKKDTSQRVSLQNAIRKKKLMFAAEPAAATPPTKNKPKQSNKQNKTKKIIPSKQRRTKQNTTNPNQTAKHQKHCKAASQAKEPKEPNRHWQSFQNTEILARVESGEKWPSAEHQWTRRHQTMQYIWGHVWQVGQGDWRREKSWKHFCRLDSLLRFRMFESCSSGTFSSIGVLWRMATFQAQVEAEPPIVAWPKDVFSAKRCTSNRSFGNSCCRANADFDGIQLSYPTAIHSVRIDVDVFWETSSLYPSGSVLWQQEVKAFLKGLRLGEKWKLDTEPMVQMVPNNVQRTKVNQVLLLWTHSGYAFYCLRKDIPFPFRTSKPEMITSSAQCKLMLSSWLTIDTIPLVFAVFSHTLQTDWLELACVTISLWKAPQVNGD